MRWSDAVEQARWIGPRLAPFDSGFVTSVVPSGFAAYARILHPLRTSAGAPVGWAQVARWSGLPLQRYSSFVDIALPERRPATPPPWDGDPPAEGSLEHRQLAALTGVLAGYGRGPYWFGVWDGYGWNASATSTAAFVEVEPDPSAEPGLAPAESGEPAQAAAPAPDDPVPTEVRSGPRVRLPNRDYLLYTGELADAGALLDSQRQSANLWWPADQAWCVASEIDLAWTYVGGSAALIQAVLDDPGLEAQRVEPNDSHWRHMPGWVAGLADRMADELMQHGRTSVRTSAGTVHARLDANGSARRHVEVTSTSIDGDRSWWSECTTARQGARLRAELADLLADAVIGPVT